MCIMGHAWPHVYISPSVEIAATWPLDIDKDLNRTPLLST